MSQDKEFIVNPLTAKAKYEKLCLKLSREILKRDGKNEV